MKKKLTDHFTVFPWKPHTPTKDEQELLKNGRYVMYDKKTGEYITGQTEEEVLEKWISLTTPAKSTSE